MTERLSTSFLKQAPCSTQRESFAFHCQEPSSQEHGLPRTQPFICGGACHGPLGFSLRGRGARVGPGPGCDCSSWLPIAGEDAPGLRGLRRPSPIVILPPEPLTSRGRAKPGSPFTARERGTGGAGGVAARAWHQVLPPGNGELGPGTVSHLGDSGRPCVLPGCVHYKCRRVLEPTRVSSRRNGRMRLWAWFQ